MDDRRALGRVHLVDPLEGRVGDQRVFVFDISLSGVRIAHKRALPTPGTFELVFSWQGEAIDLTCAVVRTRVHRRNGDSHDTVYHSGLQIVSAPPAALRDLIARHIAIALDEQKANARGIPPYAAQSVPSGGGTEFIRHELVGGLWRQLPTNDRSQPRNGFTVSATLSQAEVGMLRETWERGDYEARKLLRRFAELSIGTPDPTPMRRYEP